MAERSGYPGKTILRRHIPNGCQAAIVQGQLQFPGTLLVGHPARYGTVHLVGQPVFACHRFQLHDPLCVICQGSVVLQAFQRFKNGIVGYVFHHGMRNRSKHIVKYQVNGFFSGLCIFKSKTTVSGYLADHIHGSPFPFRCLLQQGNVFRSHDQSHAFLGLVAYDLFGTQGRISQGKFVNVYFSAGIVHQFRQTVQMTAGPVVVYGFDGIRCAFGQCPDGVVNAFLHLGIGTLYGIQLYGVAEFTCCYGGNGTPAHSYAVIVPAQEYKFVSRLRFFLQGILPTGIPYASCQHDHLIVTKTLSPFNMFKTKQ